MNKFNVIFFLLVMLGSLSVSAQKMSKKEIKELEQKADKAYGYEYYDMAVQKYEKLDSLKPENAEIKYRLGLSYMRSNHHEGALPHLKAAEKLGFKTKDKPELYLNEEHYFWESEDIDFNLARAYHLHSEFKTAITYYQKLLKKYKDAYRGHGHDEQEERISRYIRECKNGIELMKNPVDVKSISNLGPTINTEHEEIVPLISADESMLIFTSRRPSTTGGTKDEFDRWTEDIYVSYKEDGEWQEPEGISENINTPGHDACVGLSPSGNKLFIYRSNNHGTGDLYISKRDGNEWPEPEKLPEGINTRAIENDASISSDRKMLVFTSTRDGGEGAEDLYVTYLQEDSTWSEPENIKSINTPYDEDGPYLHPDGNSLYFSSKGHNTMGGFDLFKVSYNPQTKEWGEVENLGYPINTPENDVYFTFSADGERAYYSSHREDDNFGGEDLYVMEFKQEVSLILVKGDILDEETEEPIEAKITVKDNETGEVVGEYRSNKSTGKYTVILPPGKNYGFSIESDGYVHRSLNVDLPDTGEYYEQEENFEMNPLISKERSVTVLENVFFDVDEAELRKSSFSELDKYYELLKDNPELHVEIAGHTDSDGDEDYNMQLSEKRANTVVDYFVEKGIDKERIWAVGYGEEQPRVPNDTEENKQKNRRTELIIHNTAVEGEGWKKKKSHYNKEASKK